MKRFLSVVLALILCLSLVIVLNTPAQAADGVAINSTNFPDANFRSYVSSNFDSDKDGVLSKSEIAEVRTINVSNRNISNLKGIEHFTKLLDLDCSKNRLTSLNVGDVRDLICNENQLTSLNVGNCTGDLRCRDNRLTSLNLSGLETLKGVYCENNELTSLNVSGCGSLRWLHCSNNRLTSLDVSDSRYLVELDCDNNELSSLDVSDCEYVNCENNELSSLDLSGCENLLMLHCKNNALTTLDVGGRESLEWLSCSNNRLTSLDVSDSKSLEGVHCENNELTSLNVSGCAKLDELYCQNNALTALDVSDCATLDYLYCQKNALTALDVSQTPSLDILNCSGNHISKLDISNCKVLCSVYLNSEPVQDDAGGFVTYTDSYWYDDYEYFEILCVDLTTEVIQPAPVITTQPKSRTAAAGSTVKFTVAASGDDLTYQWQFKAPGTSTWNNSSMTGAKTATLTVEATAARNGQQYRCVVTNSYRSVTSEAATLTVLSKPAITTQPKNVTVAEGATAKFTVAATGGGLSYQWQYKSFDTGKWVDSGMADAKTPSISVEATAIRNGREYRCIVTNEAGSVTSDVAKMTVKAAPAIATQPKSVTTSPGKTVTFSVVARGASSYQWQFKAPGTDTWNNSGMTGAKTATLTVEATAARNGQQYRCVIKNSYGTTTSDAAKLTVLSKPAITTQPQSIKAAYGDVVKFTVAATGGSLTYQWQYKSPGSSTWKDSGMTGAKTATLKVTAEKARNGQQYRCVVKNSQGSVTSSAATLTTASIAKPTIMTQPASKTVTVGTTVTNVKLTVEAVGGNLTYQWQFKAPGTSTWYNSSMTGAKTATLTVPATTARNGQQYRCVITNSQGTVTSSAAKLTVK